MVTKKKTKIFEKALEAPARWMYKYISNEKEVKRTAFYMRMHTRIYRRCNVDHPFTRSFGRQWSLSFGKKGDARTKEAKYADIAAFYGVANKLRKLMRLYVPTRARFLFLVYLSRFMCLYVYSGFFLGEGEGALFFFSNAMWLADFIGL